jgi:hypothetical protein
LKIAGWRKEYNEVRPDSSLDYRTPNEFAQAIKKASYGKDAGSACLENAFVVSHFATAPHRTLCLLQDGTGGRPRQI